ncbi:MAG: hypothetical protein KAR35_03675 [Candidatus Heimdallarchaeota archaeon]|nr:hypothetical protein [Candidatus Heimdallarchaeota archaeon]MCK5048455.1 hypothetical protein [Candidatus Heimdallarchaeota archaeon]
MLSSYVFLTLFLVFFSDYESTNLIPSLGVLMCVLAIIMIVSQFRESFILKPRKIAEALSNKKEFLISVGLSHKSLHFSSSKLKSESEHLVED